MKNDAGDKHKEGNQQTTEKRMRACHGPGQSGNEGRTYVTEQHKYFLLNYRRPEGDRLFDMIVVSSYMYVFLLTYYVQKKNPVNYAAALSHKH